jgi:ZIP family zinc transporter
VEDADRKKAALSLGMMIALAIGLHNFSEGLAIGVSARAGAVGLAGTLIIGFALHNATEGFGIVGPLGDVRPSWSWLALAGLIGGGPTFLGTLVGYHVTSEPLEIAFYALAAGAILYVVGQIWGSASRRFSTQFVLAGLVIGFTLGLLSDLVITAGGG